MPDVLEQGLNDIFTQLSAKPIEPAPTLETHVTPPQSAALAAPVVIEPPKVETPVAVAPVVAPVVVDADAPVENWELDVPAPVAPVTPSFDFQTIAKELGFEGVKTKEELAKQVSEIKIKAEAASNNIEVLPQDLAKAVDIAKQGGNYLEYLKVSAVDWSKQDPILLFENWVYNSLAKNGKTAEDIDAYLDKIDDVDKELRGRELQNQYQGIQQQQRASIEQQTRAEKQQFDGAVQTALTSMSDVYGFKLSESQKETLYRDFTTTQIGRALLSQTGGDFKQALTGLFNIKYGAKIDQFRKQQIKNATKRELLDELQNPKITAPANITTPLSTDKIDPIKSYFDEIKIKTGL